jgi:hypothetical protein
MPFHGSVRKIYMKAALSAVLDGINDTPNWQEKLSRTILEAEHFGYTKKMLYDDIKVYVQNFLSHVIRPMTQEKILVTLLRELNLFH